MSTPRRMFEDPRNTYMIENDDPGAFDKRFVGRPGVHREQQCCRDRAPVWQAAAMRPEVGPGSHDDFHEMYVLQVADTTGEWEHTTGRDHIAGCVYVLGPKSGYKPDFISDTDWMNWQGVYWMSGPNAVHGLPNPPRWIHIGGEKKIRWSSHGYQVLWCQECETWLEGAWSEILEALPLIARGIAMIASYIPVYGTALSMAINTTVALAEGEDFSDAVVESVGRSLPGQPASGMVYSAGVSIARGERLDLVGLAVVSGGFNLDKNIADALRVADEAIYHMATGQNVGDAALATINEYLPSEAQQGMQFARRFIGGENVPEMILTQAEQVVADQVRNSAQSILDAARGKSAAELNAAEAKANALYNQYAAEFGFQMALDRLPADAQGHIRLGMTAGLAVSGRGAQFVGTFGSVSERNVAENDSYEVRGALLIASGIKYRSKLVSDIIQQKSFTITVDSYDALNNVWVKRRMVYRITDAWRRGFKVAIAVCDGSSAQGPGQLAVYQALAEDGGRPGFDAGQAVQFNRTLHGDSGILGLEAFNTPAHRHSEDGVFGANRQIEALARLRQNRRDAGLFGTSETSLLTAVPVRKPRAAVGKRRA